MMPTSVMTPSVMPKGVEHTPSALAAIVLALVLGGAVRPARAQFFDPTGGMSGGMQNIEGFTVAGKAHVAARPNLGEIDLEVAASSELTPDAIVKYRDAKR